LIEQQAAQIAALEKAMRVAPDPAERKRMADQIEAFRHVMGPYDATGARNHCQVMWHDATIDALDGEIKRLDRAGAKSIAGDLRLETRRMARSCLIHGWSITTGPLKFQVDAFGAYLANNGRMLDTLCDAVGTWAAKETRPGETAEDAAVYANAIEKAKAGLEEMRRAAGALAAAPSAPDAPLLEPLGRFATGLRAVREADSAVEEHVRKKGKPAGAAGPAEIEPPPETPLEKARVAKLRDVADKLTGDGWGEVAKGLAHYADVVEAGFQVPGARLKTRELLESLQRAAGLAEGLQASPAMTTEYLRLRQAGLALAFQAMSNPEGRTTGYERISAVWRDDAMRRQIDELHLKPNAASGLVYAYYTYAATLAQGETPEAQTQGEAVRTGVGTIVSTFLKLVPASSREPAAWPPKEMAPELKREFLQAATLFRNEVDRAAATFPTDLGASAPNMATSAIRAGDLDLLVRADAAVRAVARYRPAKVQALYVQVVKLAHTLVTDPATAAGARETLRGLVQPFDVLARFPVCETALMPAVNGFVGRAYTVAMGVLTQDVTAGIDTACAGDPAALNQALTAKDMFALLRRRAAAATYHLDKVPVGNLEAFSIAEKPWTTFVDKLDQVLRVTLGQYAKEGRVPTTTLPALAEWGDVYQPVAAAARETLNHRIAGETDLDLLLRNLDALAAARPSREQRLGWEAGYHLTEAAAALGASSLSADYFITAAWHLGQVRALDLRLRQMDLVPAKP
jgi:hypothetical protein